MADFCDEEAEDTLTYSGPVPKLSASALAQFRKNHTANMKAMNEAANNNFELQLMMLNEIHNYQKVTSAGVSMGDVVAAESQKKKGNVDIVWSYPPPGEFDRWQWAYRKWGPTMLQRPIMFCDEQVRACCDARIWSNKDSCNQMTEYGFDLSVAGYTTDYVGNNDIAVIFEGLKKSYVKKGYRLHNLLVFIQSGVMDWQSCGAYAKQVEQVDGEPYSPHEQFVARQGGHH